MSNDNKKPGFEKQASSQEDLSDVTHAFVEFLKDPTNKRRFQLFLIDYYKELEHEKVERVIARLNHMREADEESNTEFHEPSNVSDLLHETLNIKEAEDQFVETLGFAKKGLDRAVESAAHEIRNILQDANGIHEQVSPWYAKYISAFLQYRDPKKKHRDLMVLSVHMRKDDLDSSWFTDGGSIDEAWDHVTSTMTEVLKDLGMKTAYVKNDRQDRCLAMRQELVSRTTPDEYFAIRLEYETPDKLQIGIDNYAKMKLFYKQRVHALQQKIMKLKQAENSTVYRKLDNELKKVVHEQDFFLGTVPDPSQLGEGILLTVEISSGQDYHLVRNKMQMIVSHFLDRLVKDDGERSLLDQQKQRQPLGQDMVEYEVDEEHLRPVQKRKRG